MGDTEYMGDTMHYEKAAHFLCRWLPLSPGKQFDRLGSWKLWFY